MARHFRPELRELLLLAASHEFAEHGFHPVSLDRIAERCEVTKGAVYLHFRNKLDVFLEAHRHLETLRDASIEPAVEAATTARDSLETLLRAHLTFHLEHLELRRLQSILDTEVATEPVTTGRDGLRATYRAFRTRLRQLLLRAVRDHEIGPLDAAGFAFTLASLAEGALTQASAGTEDVGHFLDVPALVRAWLEGLPKPGRRRSRTPKSDDEGEDFLPAF
ncbi:MAG: TetR/AcrR family transcriptional regulator [Planctomycetes bacterium]|nr:TetR/AcrR family transcriptional regulator [Planctomycetota bacterium]MCB9919514.1 TetR/AcrR family transcriptional regulator [Planctomycetota bacterium]